MKIVYFGSDVYLSTFQYLIQAHEVLALYTYHNDEDYFTEYAIVRLAQEKGIPVHYDRISEADVRRLFLREGCRLLFVAEYDRLIPVPEDLPGFRGINIHASLLPQGRSYYPIESAMTRGLDHTGITMHKLTATLDGGEILAQREIQIDPMWDSVDVYLRCGACGLEMAEEVLSDLERHWENAQPRDEVCPYWRRPEAAARTLHHRMGRSEAMEVFRSFNKMTLVKLQGQLHYVSALIPGVETLPLDTAIIRTADDRYLYRLSDGHLRLHVEPVREDTP